MKPRRRLDDYGRPLPTLVEVSEEQRLRHPSNLHQRHYIIQVLDETLADLLQPGIHAELILRVMVHDGTLGREVTVDVTRQYREPRQEGR